MYSLLYLPYGIAFWVSAMFAAPALGPLLSGFAVYAKVRFIPSVILSSAKSTVELALVPMGSLVDGWSSISSFLLLSTRDATDYYSPSARRPVA